MKKRHVILFLIILTKATGSLAQCSWLPKVSRRDQVYGGWGWNRASYTTSDITFKGDNYNFTLEDVKAKDRQTHFKAETYFGLKTMTIPQTNFRLGYFLRDNLSISGGVDHMKYVMTQYQEVQFTGEIGDTTYDHLIRGNTIMLDDDFLTFEHTDGLNYINVEAEYYQGIFECPHFNFNVFGGAGFGALMPKSNVKLMGYPRNDEFHLAGFGLSAKFGTELLLWKHFFIRFEYKTGYINMPDIVTRHASIADRASQHFFFAQRNGMFGFNFSLNGKKTKVDKIAE